jgi:diguanylate cyclase (GGDEF)-like protein/PAS domain S-box-containing protein
MTDNVIKSNYRSIMRNGFIQAFAWTLEFMALMLAILFPLRAISDITVPTLIMVMIWALGLLNIEILHFWLRREARTLDETIKLLQKNEQKYRAVVEQSHDGIVIIDGDGKIVEWNRGQKNLTGVESGDAYNKLIWDVYFRMIPEEARTEEQLEQLKKDYQTIPKTYWQKLQGDQFHQTIIHQETGHIRILQQVFFPIQTQNGKLYGCVSRDITEQSRDHQQLRENEERFRSLFQSAPICYQSMDIHGRIMEVNKAWMDELGYQRGDVIGHKYIEFLTTESQAVFPAIFWRYVTTGELESTEFEMLRKDGSVITVDYHGKVGYNENGHFKQTHCVFFNITERKEMELEMHRLAVTDALTGIYNRRHYFELAENEFKRSQRHHLPLSAIMIDIDEFKKINDSYGHIVGDLVLQQITRACQHTMREIDIIGRYGGDEIAILLPNTTEQQAYQAAERLREGIQNLYEHHQEISIPLTISLGVAQLNEGDQNSAVLQDRADQALLAAKKAGRNRVEIWEPNNHSRVEA